MVSIVVASSWFFMLLSVLVLVRKTFYTTAVETIQPLPLMVYKTGSNYYYLLMYILSTSRCSHKASTVETAFYDQIILYVAYKRKAYK